MGPINNFVASCALGYLFSVSEDVNGCECLIPNLCKYEPNIDALCITRRQCIECYESMLVLKNPRYLSSYYNHKVSWKMSVEQCLKLEQLHYIIWFTTERISHVANPFRHGQTIYQPFYFTIFADWNIETKSGKVERMIYACSKLYKCIIPYAKLQDDRKIWTHISEPRDIAKADKTTSCYQVT